MHLPPSTPAIRVFILALALSHSVKAAQAIFIPSIDNTIYEELVNNSSGAGQFVLAGKTKGGNARRGLVHFDINSIIPTGATIDSAVLIMTVAKFPDEFFVSTTQTIHRATSPWGAQGSFGTGQGFGKSGPAEPGDATWTSNFFGSSSWTNPGGDFIATASASFLVDPIVDAQVLWTGANLVSDLQIWLDTPAQNLGWVIIGDEAFNSNARAYYSVDNTDLGKRPQLIVNYTPIPETSRLSLSLGTSILLLTALRRRS